ncbi:hypothetical protein BC832DRAFT_565995 [Gaertneriomyces semiglobifer]|nr:hypothetical protein BC832DRAFT_565995 [Gaertneriomyces semiglobifer]
MSVCFPWWMAPHWIFMTPISKITDIEPPAALWMSITLSLTSLIRPLQVRRRVLSGLCYLSTDSRNYRFPH